MRNTHMSVIDTIYKLMSITQMGISFDYFTHEFTFVSITHISIKLTAGIYIACITDVRIENMEFQVQCFRQKWINS